MHTGASITFPFPILPLPDIEITNRERVIEHLSQSSPTAFFSPGEDQGLPCMHAWSRMRCENGRSGHSLGRSEAMSRNSSVEKQVPSSRLLAAKPAGGSCDLGRLCGAARARLSGVSGSMIFVACIQQLQCLHSQFPSRSCFLLFAGCSRLFFVEEEE
jgi:hypothetical protein